MVYYRALTLALSLLNLWTLEVVTLAFPLSLPYALPLPVTTHPISPVFFEGCERVRVVTWWQPCEKAGQFVVYAF